MKPQVYITNDRSEVLRGLLGLEERRLILESLPRIRVLRYKYEAGMFFN